MIALDLEDFRGCVMVGKDFVSNAHFLVRRSALRHSDWLDTIATAAEHVKNETVCGFNGKGFGPEFFPFETSVTELPPETKLIKEIATGRRHAARTTHIFLRGATDNPIEVFLTSIGKKPVFIDAKYARVLGFQEIYVNAQRSCVFDDPSETWSVALMVARAVEKEFENALAGAGRLIRSASV